MEERTAVPDFDAEGNRHVRWILESLLTRFHQLDRDLGMPGTAWTSTVGGRAVADRWRTEIHLLRPELRRRLRYEWIAAAGTHHGSAPTATLQQHPGYARVLGAGRALLEGLHIDARPITDAPSRPVSDLYEYWCFIALVELLRQHGRIEQCSAIQLSSNGSRVSLRKGREAAVTFRHRDTGQRFDVYYNRQYPTPTLAQRPDASVHIESATGICVFDAKYRLQFDADYVNTYGGVGPRVDDVSTMHRYRDAIVVPASEGGFRRLVRTACVLFPWTEAAQYRDHAFCRSLDAVGVGGLPFLPSCTDLVAERLNEIVAGVLSTGETDQQSRVTT